MPIRLVIADDHEVVRSGLKNLLADSEFQIVGEAASGEEVVAYVSDLEPDVLLLDIRMPEGDGLGALSKIKHQYPDLPVLILSTYDNPTYVARAVALGASGYVLKGSGREKLVQAIRRVAAGELAWTREDLRRVARAPGGASPAPDLESALTPRELEVVGHLAHGHSNQEIAQALSISYETVKEHVQNVLRKIGVADRTQAAVWAVRQGLDSLGDPL
jgi:DNA-binding NarL/FixJ family response regulator